MAKEKRRATSEVLDPPTGWVMTGIRGLVECLTCQGDGVVPCDGDCRNSSHVHVCMTCGGHGRRWLA